MVGHKQGRGRGFTLVEMLAAIAIFSVVSLSAWQILQGVIRAHEVIIGRNEQFKQLQYTLLLLDRDLQQIADRGPRSGGAITSAGLFSDRFMLDSDDEALALVRYGWHNPHQLLPRSELQRVFYRLSDNVLERQFHYVLDTEHVDAEPITQPLLSNVSTLEFRFFHDGLWQNDLPNTGRLPKALAVSFTLDGIGVIERKYLLPESWQDNETNTTPL